MKNFKKILSLILAITMVVTMFSINSLFTSADILNKDVIEEIDVDLNNSQIVRNSNGGNVVFRLLEQEPLRADFWPGWNSLSGTMSYSEALMDLRSGDTPIRLTQGYKYAINVRYTVVKATDNPQIGIVYNIEDDLNVVNEGSHVLKAATHTATGSYMLSVVADGVEDRPLRIAFGGQGQIVIESVEIKRVSNLNLEFVQEVSYNNEGLTSVDFAKGEFTTPNAAYAIDSVFGGWYTDSSFTTKATVPQNNTTYYAKWLSITRKVNLKFSNRMANYNEGQDETSLKITTYDDSEAITVVSGVANKSVSAGNSISNETSQQISLEYYDLEPNLQQDSYYGGYVSLKKDKWYVINVDYSVTAATSATSLMIFSNSTNLSGGTSRSLGVKSTTYDSANNTGAGDYTLYTELKSGGLIDCTYGGSSDNDKIRLGFYGNGTFVIKSVTIQEIDKNAESVPVYYMHNGAKFKAAAVNDGAEWKINEPILYGKIKDKLFSGWYEDDIATAKMETPTSLNTYYPKWMTITRELDLKNLNRTNGWNDGGTDDNNLKLTNATDDSPMSVYVNQTTAPSNFYSGSDMTGGGSQQVTLEYFDFDAAVQDKVYGGYAYFEKGKSYAFNIDYTIKENSGGATIYLVSNASFISNTDDKKTKYITYKSISKGVLEEGVINVQYKSGNLINAPGYGSNQVGDKFRLAFYGNAVIEINSITIQEIYTADQTAKAVGIYYVDNGKKYKAAAINDNGTWLMPEVVKHGYKGNVVEAKVSGWYSDSSLTNLMTTPTSGSTYYPKWDLITRELDLKNVNRMASGSDLITETTILKLTPETTTTPLTVVINDSNYNLSKSEQQVSLEYYDEDGKDAGVKDTVLDGYAKIEANKLYAVTVKFSVTNVGSNAPQIALVSNNTSLSYGNGGKTLAKTTLNKNGDYVLSQVVYAGLNGCATGDKMRLSFAGQGTFEIESVTITESNPSSKYIPVVYNDSVNSAAYFLNESDSIINPTERNGYLFMGWYDANGQKITSVSQLSTGSTINTLTAKWMRDRFEREYDLTISKTIKNTDNDSNVVMQITPDNDNKSINIDLDSYIGTNYFWDSEGNINTTNLWPHAILAIKSADDNELSSYATFYNDYKYAINLEYEVTEFNYNYNPQIAIVRNGNTEKSTNTGGSVVLNANKHNTTGEFTMSAVVSNLNEYPLRLAFAGVGNIIIKSLTVTQIDVEDDRYIDLTYIDDKNSKSDFVKPGTELLVPEKEDYFFKGWYDLNDVKVENIDGTTNPLKLYAKWIVSSQKYDIDLTNKFVVKQKPTNKDNIVMTVTDDKENKDLLVELNSDWNNVFADKDGNFKNGPLWPNAILGIRYNDGLDSSDFVRFDKNYKYAINLSYEVLEADSVQLIQVALVNHIGTANQGDTHGSSVLNTATHKKVGKYKLSVVVSDLDNVALRLAFSGIGKINLTSMDVQVVSVEVDNMSLVNMGTKEGLYTQFFKNDTDLPVLENTKFANFGGWFSGSEQITTVSNDVDVTAKWYGKHDVTMNDEIDIRDLVTLGEAYDSATTNELYDVDRDGNVDNADLIAVKQYLLGVIAIGDNSLADFAVVKGAQKTLLTTLAAENFVSEVKTAFDIDLQIKDDASKKVVIGIEDIPEEVLEDQAINTLTGVRGDVYGVNDFKVFVYNGNLYVEAGSDYATAVGVNALLDYLKSNFAFAGDFELSGTCTKASEMLDGYSYKLGDEFNEDTFNTNKWYFANEVDEGTNYSRDSEYYQNTKNTFKYWYDPEGNPNMQDGKIYYGENYSLNDGALVLNTKRTEQGYSAAKINGKQSFTYGIMTARVKLATKNGATSAVWARTVDDNGATVNEMDFCENYGAEKQVVPNLHTWNNYDEDTNHFEELDYKQIVNYEEETYHELALVWTSEKITFYFDGEVYLEQDITDLEKWGAFHKSSYMIFDVGVPSNYYADAVPEGVNSGKPGDILGTLIDSFNENMYIDYVRVFQQ